MLQKTGLLEEREVVQLDDALQVSGIFNLLFVVVSGNSSQATVKEVARNFN